MSLTACPICGKDERNHKCNPKTLAAIDRTMKQERDVPQQPSFRERLATGFFMLSLNER